MKNHKIQNKRKIEMEIKTEEYILVQIKERMDVIQLCMECIELGVWLLQRLEKTQNTPEFTNILEFIRAVTQQSDLWRTELKIWEWITSKWHQTEEFNAFVKVIREKYDQLSLQVASEVLFREPRIHFQQLYIDSKIRKIPLPDKYLDMLNLQSVKDCFTENGEEFRIRIG
ncbi:MAG: hypothetical protein EAX86_09340 [Candidatus Heimdallarchaeota archaeon]|nr:hypothetical protein [Candidatus Heimdallarchaeota archaeon]